MALAAPRWDRWHAAAMLLTAVLCAAIRSEWPLATAGLLSFGVFVVARHRAWTQGRRFGAANAVTALRLGLASALLLFSGTQPLTSATLLAAFLALDGVDGWIARRTNSASAFGARFDMETDAFGVLATGVVLCVERGLGAWILLGGLLRYVYVLALPLASGKREQPRSAWTRAAFAVAMVFLIGALGSPRGVARASGALATVLLSASFAYSFFWSFGPGGRLGETTPEA
jgi:phosphatidylglycerophosphate synthase